MPLATGTNWITVTAMDAWSNSFTTNIVILQSGLTLTIDPIDPNRLHQGSITVRGTVGGTGQAVSVNGIAATVTGGSWSAAAVPVTPGGTASFAAEATAAGQSTGKADANVDKPERLYVASDENNLADNYFERTDYWGGGWVQHTNTYRQGHSWMDGSPDSKGWVQHTNRVQSSLPSDGTLKTVGDITWPAAKWPDLMAGAWTYTAREVTGGIFENPPVIGSEHCEVKLRTGWVWALGEKSGWWTSDYTRHAQTKWRLETGGKKLSGRRNLWRLSGTADELLEKRALPPFTGADMRVIDRTRIEILNQALGADGVLWQGLPDGESLDVTPVVAGKGFYKFTVEATKYKLRITANGQDCESLSFFFRPTFIVGQYVSFGSQWDQAPPYSGTPPDIVNYLTTNKWEFGGRFYNDGTNAVPGVSFPVCSRNYLVNANMLADDPTTAWWVSGGYGYPRSYDVSLEKGLTFANGQHVVVNGSGTFQMYRPQATITPSTTSVNVFNMLPELRFADDSTGVPVNGITFANTVSIPYGFSGSTKWVQVVSSALRRLQDTSSNWHVRTPLGPAPYVDNGFPYSKFDTTGANPVDSPWLPLFFSGYLRGEAANTFEMYMLFEPPGGMWVPLRVVNWSWSGSATNGPIVWELDSGTKQVNSNVETENYPFWKSDIANSIWIPAIP